MRKLNSVILMPGLLCLMAVNTVFASTGPAELRGENGSTFTVSVSRDSANVLMVSIPIEF